MLATSDPDTTPMLEEVTVSRDPQGTSDREEPLQMSTELLPVRPNPARGGVEIRYRLAEAAPVDLRIYDVSGRLADNRAWKSRPEGIHRYSAEGLPSGVYLCRLVCGENTFTERFVLLQQRPSRRLRNAPPDPRTPPAPGGTRRSAGLREPPRPRAPRSQGPEGAATPQPRPPPCRGR